MTFFGAFMGTLAGFASIETWKWWKQQYRIEKKK